MFRVDLLPRRGQCFPFIFSASSWRPDFERSMEVENSRSSPRSVFCYSRSSAGQDFAHFSLLGGVRERKHLCYVNIRVGDLGLLYGNDASSSDCVAVPCILCPLLVHSRGMSCDAYPNVISGSTADLSIRWPCESIVQRPLTWLNLVTSLRSSVRSATL
jgi:hypothetical protein